MSKRVDIPVDEIPGGNANVFMWADAIKQVVGADKEVYCFVNGDSGSLEAAWCYVPTDADEQACIDAVIGTVVAVGETSDDVAHSEVKAINQVLSLFKDTKFRELIKTLRAKIKALENQ